MSNSEPSSDVAGSGGEKEIVFVSYTGHDQKAAEFIAWEIEATGRRAIIQCWDFVASRSFVTQMDAALASGARVVAVLSERYLQSAHCRAEWETAYTLDPDGSKGMLLVARIEKFDHTSVIRRYPYEDIFGVPDQELCERIHRLLNRERRKPTNRPPLPASLLPPAAQPQPAVHRERPPVPPSLTRPPLPPNPDLTDRDIETARFDTIRAKHGTPDAPRAIVLLGQGGIGKTQLCVHLAHRIRDSIQVFLFVNADTPDIFRSSLAQYATAAHLGLPDDGGKSDRDRAAAVRAWLVQNGGWFLAMENVDSEATEAIVREFIEGLDLDAPPDRSAVPLHSTGTVIVTARHWQERYGYDVLDIRVFAADVGAGFLTGRCGLEAGTEAEARELSKEFGGLPLALEQAAHFIHRTHGTYVEYLQYIREGIAVLKPADQHGHTRYQFAAELTWQRQLQHLSPLALHLFRLNAFLLPDEIPAALLLHENNRHAMPPGNRREALAELDAHHLIQHHGGTIGVHRYIHGPLRRQMQPVEAKECLTALLDQFYGYVATLSASWEYNSRPVWTPLAPHLHECLNAAHASALDAESFGYLSNELGNFFWHTADLARAEPHMRRALEVSEKAGQTESVNFADRCGNLGVVLRGQGDYAAAERYQRRALEIDEQALGPAHPEVATDCGNLGNVLRDQGNYAEAERYLRRALEIDEKALGPAHRDVAVDCGNLGNVLRDQGNYAEAERYVRRALEIHEKVLGPAHPYVATGCGRLGNVLREQGNYAEAERYLRRALEIDEKALGPAHPSVATGCGNLGGVLSAQGNYAESERYRRRELEIDEKALGPAHPHVAIARYQLGNVLRESGQQEEAGRLLREGIAGLEARADFNQSYLALARWRLAQWHERNGRADEAHAEGARALEIHTKALGAEHPETKKIKEWLDALGR